VSVERDNSINLRNPFAGFNASLMNDDEIIQYWIEPHVLFGRTALGIDLTGNIPVVLMGGRGTGKTMLLKFMSNEVQIKEYLSKHKNGSGFLIETNYLGVYHRFDGPSLASFADRNVTDEAWETIFKHYLEVVIGQNYATMLRNLKQAGCIDLSDDAEKSLISEMFKLIDENAVPDPEGRTLDSLIVFMQEKLDRVFEFINKSALSKEVEFSDDVLTSGKLIFRLPDIMQHFIPAFKGKNTIVLLDEYENLKFEQQKIVNTLIKHTRLPVTFRIGTRLNGFKTFETLIKGEFLMVDADYREILFENVLTAREGEYMNLLRKIAEKRLEQVPEFKESKLLDIEELLGRTTPEDEALMVVFGSKMKKNELERYPLNRYTSETKHIQEMKTILESRYLSQADGLLQKLVYLQNPLIEMLNLLLLRREYEVDEIIGCFRTYINKEKKDERYKKYKNLYDKNKLGLLFQLISLNRPTKKLYAGFNVYCMLSSGIIRNFLELCYQSFNRAIFLEGGELIKKRTIPFAAQTGGARTRAERFLEVIDRIPEYGTEIKSLVQSFGAIFYTWQKDPRLSEPEVTYFCLDSTALSEKGKNVLDMAVRWSVLQQKPPMKGKDPREPLRDVYALNRILAPYFGISYRLRGRYSTINKKDLETLMFGNDMEKQRVINRLSRKQSFEKKDTSLLEFMEKSGND
jgi:hypothetical protein